MKKKVLLTLTVILASAMLFACGSPLKKLPKATGENIYSSSTTGNEYMDGIIDELKDKDAIQGRITSLAIYDREDDEKNKDKAVISMKVDSETANAKYLSYYIVDCRYSKDTGWRVKSFELDEHAESTVTPEDNVMVEQIEEDIRAQVADIKILDNKVNLDFSEDLLSAEIKSENVEVCTEDRIPVETLVAEYKMDGKYCYYIGTVQMTYKFYDTADLAGWVLEDYTLDNNTERQLTDDSLVALADKKMINAFCLREQRIANENMTFDEKDFASFDFSEKTFDGDLCNRTANVVLKTDKQISITFDVAYQYKYNASGWKLDNLDIEMHISIPDMVGEYSGNVYSSKEAMEEGEDRLGKAYYSVLTQKKDGDIKGAIRYLNDGQTADDVEPIYFSATFYENSLAWKISFDSEVDDKKYGFDDEYLYYNPFTGEVTEKSWNRYYSLHLME